MIDITIKRRAKKTPRIRIVRKKGYISLLTRVKRSVSSHRPRIRGFKILSIRLPRIGFSD
jgi:hypothetical protein